MRVTESMGPAWETMKRILFRPFSAGTWFSFGFIFFLQSCMEGGGGGGNGLRLPNGGGGGGGGSGGHGGDTGNNVAGIAHDLARSLAPSSMAESEIIIIILAIACVVAIPLIILAMWLGTRGQMMGIRSVAYGQANIGEQWNATRESGGMLFKFNLAMTGLSLLVFVPLAVVGVIVLLPVMRDGVAIESVLPAVLGIGAVAILLMFPFFLISAMARNFVAPIMLKHGIGARDAWKRFWAVGRNHVGGIFLFYFMRLVVGIGAAIVGTVASLLTCCLGFLPILHQTLMAPYYVFERAWVLEVLASMSPDFDMRTAGPPAPDMPYTHGGAGFNPYAGTPSDNPYAPPGYGGGGGGGNPYGGGGEPPGGFGGR